MKLRSGTANDKIYLERWETPLSQGHYIYLLTVLTCGGHCNAFFELRGGSTTKGIHVMSIPQKSSLRIIEENLAYSCISNRYFSNTKNEPHNFFLTKKMHSQHTWKLYGTQFAREIDTNRYSSKRNINFQYLIKTSDQDIEFVSNVEPFWKYYKNESLRELQVLYIKNEASLK
jgi:hypothetical protein